MLIILGWELVLWSRIGKANNLVVAEIFALERVVEVYLEIGLEKAIFQGDALAVFKDVQKIEENYSSRGQMI